MKYITLLISLFLCGCSINSNKDPLLFDTQEILRNSPKEFNIRTVIFVEASDNNISDEAIFKQITYCETLFQYLNIRFVVEDIIVIDLNGDNWDNYAHLPKLFAPHYLTIIYVPNIDTESGPAWGLAPFPWHEENSGIYLTEDCSITTLAHEFGHYCGLFHTFEEDDFVHDTQIMTMGTTKNIMDAGYPFGFKYVTLGQLERMRVGLISYRKRVYE